MVEKQGRRLIVGELDHGRSTEETIALPGAVTRINNPFPLKIDPAGIARQ